MLFRLSTEGRQLALAPPHDDTQGLPVSRVTVDQGDECAVVLLCRQCVEEHFLRVPLDGLREGEALFDSLVFPCLIVPGNGS